MAFLTPVFTAGFSRHVCVIRANASLATPCEVDSSDVIWGMNLCMCEPSFYRALVSCDTIGCNVIGGQLLAGK